MKQSLCYAADFETTTDINDCRVWAYSLCNVEDPSEFIYGNSIEGFIDWCKEKENRTLYFHNLRFDSEYILSYLGTHGYSFVADKKEKADFTYTTLISDTGDIYSLEIYFEVKKKRVNKVTIYDSLKIFPNFSVDKIAKSFDLPISKLKIDYHKYRPVGYELDQQEIDYIRNDVEIVARALKQMFNNGLTKITLASDALTFYKTTIPDFRALFPILPKEIDSIARASYRGGFTYVSDKYKEVECGAGLTLDVNSLYPSILRYEVLPYSHPKVFEGKYEYDPVYPLYVQEFTCKFELKPEKIPSIQIKNSLSFIPNEYLTSSKDELVTLTLTNIDLDLFLENYEVEEMTYSGGLKFKGMRGNFDKYVDHWVDQKIKADHDENKGQRQIAKLMLNSLYGKFGLSGVGSKKVPVVSEDGKVSYVLMKDKDRQLVYCPVAAFVTSYGRSKVIRTSMAIREWGKEKLGFDPYVYSDTDSIKCLIKAADLENLKDVVQVDKYLLGYWALEEEFDKILCIRQKCYITFSEGRVHPTVAGLPKYLAPIINFDNFRRGFTTAGLTVDNLKEMARANGATEEEIEEVRHKTTYKHVPGGVILYDTEFTIK